MRKENNMDGWPELSIGGFIVIVIMIWIMCHWRG